MGLESNEIETLDYAENPLNWPHSRKWLLSIIVIMASATMAYYSGVHAASIPAIAEYYHASQLASTSGVSFFLLGFAIGPLLFAPLSEMYASPIIPSSAVRTGWPSSKVFQRSQD